MKSVQNPTTYFFKQAQNIPDKIDSKIQQYANRLLDPTFCGLCRCKYDLGLRIPRILIHCGHTLCTNCLDQFYRRHRIRCPLCLKLIKHIEGVDVLPINHSIFRKLIKQYNDDNKGQQLNADQELFKCFQEAQKISKPQNFDKETGLPFCVNHIDRVEHFYCTFHKLMACRVCYESGHTKKECQIVDLYQVEDIEGFMAKKGEFMPRNKKDQIPLDLNDENLSNHSI